MRLIIRTKNKYDARGSRVRRNRRRGGHRQLDLHIEIPSVFYVLRVAHLFYLLRLRMLYFYYWLVVYSPGAPP